MITRRNGFDMGPAVVTVAALAALVIFAIRIRI